ncbi:hypothetical protein NEMBOFW57_006064 [Staphylotrichum longicolle]|uniref:Uncharacterized protein n=1 Tax=Staphylotrichum longicolle TaxID=669026 RepID=A0AAD4F2M3_9PEZI|nr:hypothetical protein NEMBOFW57_006064 [Staphylotrichum longicolle]
MAPDPKASPGTSKSGKNGSSEKVNKAASESSDGTTPNRPQSAKSRSLSSPICMPKSILRVSSPDGPGSLSIRRPESPPVRDCRPLPQASLPTSPIPHATVRFAKATTAGRRFLPVKRKSKSTLTYISPLDPGTQKSAPKTMLQSPTKMRRHQENQAAMGRYWLRTEEEEAQWRAEAERRAQEEAEKYRNEPASSPPPAASVATKSDEEAGRAVQSSLADAMADIDKLPPLDSGPALEKVEEEVMESEDEDEGAGAKCK